MTDHALIQCVTEGPIATIWLGRPEVRNALSDPMKSALIDAIELVDSDPHVRVIVLRGRGRSFCAGADRRGFDAIASATRATVRESLDIGARMIRTILQTRSIVVAAIHGHCIGGGVSIALACDLSIAAQDTVFFVPEVDLGLPYLWGSTGLMLMTLGLKRGNYWSLTCDRFGGTEALDMGLVNSIHAPEHLDAALTALTGKLAAKPEAALLAQKTLTNRLIGHFLAQLGEENELGLSCLASAHPHLAR